MGCYPGPLGWIRAGRVGDFNNDNMILMHVFILLSVVVLYIDFTSLSLITYVNLCSVTRIIVG